MAYLSRNLFFICATEIGERFSFYMTRNILVLYMIKVFLFSNAHAYVTFATFTGLLYFTPLMGGYLADRWLTTKSAVIMGGLLLSLGYFLLAKSEQDIFYVGLATLIVGNGFFMPNIAKAVGHLYENNETQRESGFTLFYIAIQIGALIPPLIASGIIFRFGWNVAFLFSAMIILLTTFLFYFTYSSKDHSFSYFKYSFFVIGIILSIISFTVFAKNATLANIAFCLLSSIFIFYAVKKSFDFSPAKRNRLLVCHLLIAFSILFWMLYEQVAMSLTVFLEYNVNRSFGHFTIPTISFFVLNPLIIIFFGSLFSKMWLWLDRYHLNPSIPAKFAYGTILMGIGFVFLPFAIMTYSSGGQISFYWIVLCYFLQSIGELFLSPIGLSMVIELSPKTMHGLMMGVWYFATAVANILAGFASAWTTVSSKTNLPMMTSPQYAHVFGELGMAAILAGMIVLIFTPRLKKAMTLNEPPLSIEYASSY